MTTKTSEFDPSTLPPDERQKRRNMAQGAGAVAGAALGHRLTRGSAGRFFARQSKATPMKAIGAGIGALGIRGAGIAAGAAVGARSVHHAQKGYDTVNQYPKYAERRKGDGWRVAGGTVAGGGAGVLGGAALYRSMKSEIGGAMRGGINEMAPEMVEHMKTQGMRKAHLYQMSHAVAAAGLGGTGLMAGALAGGIGTAGYLALRNRKKKAEKTASLDKTARSAEETVDAELRNHAGYRAAIASGSRVRAQSIAADVITRLHKEEREAYKTQKGRHARSEHETRSEHVSRTKSEAGASGAAGAILGGGLGYAAGHFGGRMIGLGSRLAPAASIGLGLVGGAVAGYTASRASRRGNMARGPLAITNPNPDRKVDFKQMKRDIHQPHSSTHDKFVVRPANDYEARMTENHSPKLASVSASAVKLIRDNPRASAGVAGVAAGAGLNALKQKGENYASRDSNRRIDPFRVTRAALLGGGLGAATAHAYPHAKRTMSVVRDSVGNIVKAVEDTAKNVETATDNVNDVVGKAKDNRFFGMFKKKANMGLLRSVGVPVGVLVGTKAGRDASEDTASNMSPYGQKTRARKAGRRIGTATALLGAAGGVALAAKYRKGIDSKILRHLGTDLGGARMSNHATEVASALVSPGAAALGGVAAGYATGGIIGKHKQRQHGNAKTAAREPKKPSTSGKKWGAGIGAVLAGAPLIAIGASERSRAIMGAGLGVAAVGAGLGAAIGHDTDRLKNYETGRRRKLTLQEREIMNQEQGTHIKRHQNRGLILAAIPGALAGYHAPPVRHMPHRARMGAALAGASFTSGLGAMGGIVTGSRRGMTSALNLFREADQIKHASEEGLSRSQTDKLDYNAAKRGMGHMAVGTALGHAGRRAYVRTHQFQGRHAVHLGEQAADLFQRSGRTQGREAFESAAKKMHHHAGRIQFANSLPVTLPLMAGLGALGIGARYRKSKRAEEAAAMRKSAAAPQKPEPSSRYHEAGAIAGALGSAATLARPAFRAGREAVLSRAFHRGDAGKIMVGGMKHGGGVYLGASKGLKMRAGLAGVLGAGAVLAGGTLMGGAALGAIDNGRNNAAQEDYKRKMYLHQAAERRSKKN